jgi:hypothetical protein
MGFGSDAARSLAYLEAKRPPLLNAVQSCPTDVMAGSEATNYRLNVSYSQYFTTPWTVHVRCQPLLFFGCTCFVSSVLNGFAGFQRPIESTNHGKANSPIRRLFTPHT